MATRSLNKVMLIGNMTRDPELKYTGKGTAVCSFGLATNRSWTGDDGKKEERAQFFNIVAWTKLAEICAQLLHKGDKVFVEGRLQTHKWQGDDGQDRRTTEVVIDNMLLLRSIGGRKSNGKQQQADDDQANDSAEEDLDLGDEAIEDVEDVSDDIPF